MQQGTAQEGRNPAGARDLGSARAKWRYDQLDRSDPGQGPDQSGFQDWWSPPGKTRDGRRSRYARPDRCENRTPRFSKRAAFGGSRSGFRASRTGIKDRASAGRIRPGQLQNARDNLAYTDLKSDVAGSVTAKGAEPGEVVAAGRMILQVARQGGRDAVFNVPSQLIRQSPKNPEVTVALSDDPTIVATGHVREVAPQADAATGTYVVKVALDNPPDAMRLGATIVGQVKVQSEPVIQLPGTALTQSEGKPAVWVVDPDKKTVSLVQVIVGHYDTSSAVVSRGLKDGDLVVTAGVQALRPGQEVRLLETGSGVQK